MMHQVLAAYHLLTLFATSKCRNIYVATQFVGKSLLNGTKGTNPKSVNSSW